MNSADSQAPGGTEPPARAALSTATADTWDRLRDRIRAKITEHAFRSWFAPTESILDSDSRLLVRVPNAWFANWLQTSYSTLIEEAKRELNLLELTIEFQAALSEVPPPPPAGTPEPPEAVLPPIARPQTQSGNLNPRYTFSNYVVSSCNAFARAAALAVAEQPRPTYNPLYLYGGVGLGKTHLMQAICHRIAAREEARLHYTSAEHFMNDLINAIRFNKTQEFKERYRSLDVLLIDDVQFLAGKERTQEELFHTFNALYDTQRQIVLTSDVPPREIPGLEDRLRSRFEWGLMADLQPPDLETKVAILRKKAEADSVRLGHDVALFIASQCSSNIRELEGSLIRLVAYASLNRREIDLDLAREVLKDSRPAAPPAATTESIQKLVAEHFGLRVTQLKSRSNSRQITHPRHIAMFLCKELTECSLQEIGRRFGGKHHSTVIHGIQKVTERRAIDPGFNTLIESFTNRLK